MKVQMQQNPKEWEKFKNLVGNYVTDACSEAKSELEDYDLKINTNISINDNFDANKPIDNFNSPIDVIFKLIGEDFDTWHFGEEGCTEGITTFDFLEEVEEDVNMGMNVQDAITKFWGSL